MLESLRLNPEVVGSNTSLGYRIDKLTRERKGKDTQAKAEIKSVPQTEGGSFHLK